MIFKFINKYIILYRCRYYSQRINFIVRNKIKDKCVSLRHVYKRKKNIYRYKNIYKIIIIDKSINSTVITIKINCQTVPRGLILECLRR